LGHIQPKNFYSGALVGELFDNVEETTNRISLFGLGVRRMLMLKCFLVSGASVAMLTAAAAAAADLPRAQPVYQQAQVGKAPIGKTPIGKTPVGKAPIGKAPLVTRG
jgi:hypothetical protein